ncbi:MAG: OmpA family protein, partial [Paludibacteraceae bacterium]|nr:OmpA family protein [Paludibacteraceae bacterium]
SDNKKETKAVNMTAISIGAVAPLNNIFFDFDSNTLKKESFGELKRIIRFLAENPKANIELAGHTDSIGSREYNIKLSERRAKAVYEYMIKHGVPEDRISYKGYGPDLPIASNETDEGRAKNRRTEIRITKY